MSGRRRVAEGSGTLSARVMSLIGRRIVAGEYEAGEVLPPELALCRQFGLSRTPLREAMKRLHAKGLIAVGPKSGTRVLPPETWNQFDADVLAWRFEAAPSDSILDQLYDLRIVFEPEACRIAARNGSRGEHAAIARAFSRMVEFQHDPLRVVEPDIEFHRAILAATRNMFLISVGAAIGTALQFQFRLTAERNAFPARELEQHRLICECILARDGERAMAHMRDLIGQSRRTLGLVLHRDDVAGARGTPLRRKAARR